MNIFNSEESKNSESLQNKHDRIIINKNGRMSVLNICDILRLESMENYTLIITFQGEEFVSTKSLIKFSFLLYNFQFLQSHRAHFINIDGVKHVDSDGVVYLTDGSTIPLSRRNRKRFLEQFFKA